MACNKEDDEIEFEDSKTYDDARKYIKIHGHTEDDPGAMAYKKI